MPQIIKLQTHVVRREGIEPKNVPQKSFTFTFPYSMLFFLVSESF